jgi:hypothetical protein
MDELAATMYGLVCGTCLKQYFDDMRPADPPSRKDTPTEGRYHPEHFAHSGGSVFTALGIDHGYGRRKKPSEWD